MAPHAIALSVIDPLGLDLNFLSRRYTRLSEPA
jgi:hypothetical protein